MAKQQEDTKGASSKGSAGKNILFGMLVIAALAAGSAGVTLYLQKNPDSLPLGDTVAATAAPVNHKNAPPLYLLLDPPFVVNFEDQGTLRYLQISLSVMTRDKMMLEKMTDNLPPIRNNLIALFSKQNFTALISAEGKDKLRSQALEEIQSVLREETGRPGAEAVYFTHFVMQ